jgi:hypothetical protein
MTGSLIAAFEFNELLLVTILRHVYSGHAFHPLERLLILFVFSLSLCVSLGAAFSVTGRRRFGTFLCNSEKSRREIEVQNRTVSVWHAINTDDYWVYRTEAITHLDPLRADTSNLQLWENLYKTYYSFVEGEGKVRISPNKFQ